MSAKGKLSRPAKVIIMVYSVGAVLIYAGQTIYCFANQRINELIAKISPSLSDYEYGMIKGSLDWRRPALVYIYGPISLYLITAGIVILTFLTVYTALLIMRSK